MLWPLKNPIEVAERCRLGEKEIEDKGVEREKKSKERRGQNVSGLYYRKQGQGFFLEIPLHPLDIASWARDSKKGNLATFFFDDFQRGENSYSLLCYKKNSQNRITKRRNAMNRKKKKDDSKEKGVRPSSR